MPVTSTVVRVLGLRVGLGVPIGSGEVVAISPGVPVTSKVVVGLGVPIGLASAIVMAAKAQTTNTRVNFMVKAGEWEELGISCVVMRFL